VKVEAEGMTNDVCITFRSRVEAGETSFVVPVQRKFADEPNRRYGFESITVMPEYQSTQAFAYNLDSKAELEAELAYPLQLEISYGPGYFSRDVPGKSWSFLMAMKRIDNVLVSVNQHYDKNKPPGTYYSPVFFDWCHMEGLNEDTTMSKYTEETAKDAYGENFDAAKHRTWLTPSMALVKADENDKMVQDCAFPTQNVESYMADVRVRMWIAPNTMVTFSNPQLPIVLGFQDYQIPPRSKKGQTEYTNEDVKNYLVVPAHGPPMVNVPVDKVKATKLNCYVAKSTVLSPVTELKTNRKEERDPKLLVVKYAEVISKLAKVMNVYMNLEYSEATKKFKVVYPTNANISIRIFVPTHVLSQLGYDPSERSSDCIEQKSTPGIVSLTVDVEDLEKKGRALVFDTGMMAVDVEEQTSHLSSHSGTFLMATLHPREDGTLRNRVYLWDVPRVQVSYTNPNLRFVLYRFDDVNHRIPLGWPVSAYVFGTLNGRV